MVRVSEQCLGSADQPDARANVGARLARRNGAGIWWQRLSLPAEGGNWSRAATPVLSAFFRVGWGTARRGQRVVLHPQLSPIISPDVAGASISCRAEPSLLRLPHGL